MNYKITIISHLRRETNSVGKSEMFSCDGVLENFKI